WLRRLRICASRLLILDRQSSRFIEAPEAHRSPNPVQYRRIASPAQVVESSALARCQIAPLPRAQPAERERAEAHAPKPSHRMSQRLAIALDLAIAPLGEAHLEPRRVGAAAKRAHAARDRGPIAEQSAAPPPRKIAARDHALHLHLVHARQLVARMQE